MSDPVAQNPADQAMKQLLVEGVMAMAIAFESRVMMGCVAHWRLVQAYNQRTNLTSISRDGDAAFLHYLDSLAAASLLKAGTVVDFGSGAGFPGIPLALARPDLDFQLVEPRRKRVSFLRYAIATLELKNVRVFEGRLEDVATSVFSQAVTRATFSNSEAFASVKRWVQPTGCLWVWRSDLAEKRPGEAPGAFFRHTYRLGALTRHIEQWTWPPARA